MLALRPALRAETRRLLRLAAPLILALQLQMANGFVDAAVAGRIGSEELAAGGIGAALWFILQLTCIGLMAGLSPMIARMRGQGRQLEIGALVRQGLWLAGVAGLAMLLAGFALRAGLGLFGIEPVLVPLIDTYLAAAMWGLPAAALLSATRNVFEAASATRAVLVVQCLGLAVNVVCDLGLGLGWFGLPALGLAGIGWSTTAVMVAMASAQLWLLHRGTLTRYQVFARFEWPQWAALRSLLALSVPVCLAMLFEAGLFTATSVQMGILGVIPAGAHQIAIGVTSICFMLPLGLSSVLAARLGQSLGRSSLPSIRLRASAGALVAFAMASCTVVLLLLSRHWVTGIYTPDLAVRALAAHLMIYAAIFQFSDGAQVVLFNLLRGLHDTRVPMVINGFAYWVIAFGLGALLAHHTWLGPDGLWIGLTVGLSVSAALLGWRLRTILRRMAEQLSDAHS